MKKTNLLYWIITGLFSAFMLSTAIPELLMTPDTIAFTDHLGYPNYLNPFLGVAKILGILALFIPGYPRIREWAYAGFFFDLFGATYSGIANDGFDPRMTFMILPFTFLFVSYYLHHKRMNAAL